MEWIDIKKETTLHEIRELSEKEKVLVFKNDSGMVSLMIKKLLEREWNESYMNMKTFIIDVQKHKLFSDLIVRDYGAEHIVPQVLIIKTCTCIHTKANGHIQYSDLKQFANR